ncbi:DUF6398 domain-containing protein [Paraburkholderia youngii]|uniref:DUF6398 domain-containing protein n=1 Tax=Paraburkholderia youngii TaxID=2782701 RepID=A0A7Y6N2I0_9BURK|nr:DUF6398 domain-containing protein [Paraburkholderia youngii]NUY06258.1 hypothetical protein [Paraburkholderia youngii]
MSTERIPNALQTRYDEITALTDAVCGQHLSDEYRDLCRRMAATLCRKRPSPLINGPARSWACGIAYAVGRVNGLFYRDQTPHMRADVLCEHFRVSPKTGSAKASAIIAMLKIGAMDPRWSLPSQLARNPMAWMLEVNGYIVDARQMPRDFQEEAFRRGLIPYIP